MVQSSFSTAEIRRLLEAWGADPAALDGDQTTLAHRLVGLGDKRFGTAEMTRRLRAEKPLLEWPEDDPGSERWAGPLAGLEDAATEAEVSPHDRVTPTAIDEPPALELEPSEAAPGAAAEQAPAPVETPPVAPAPAPRSNPMVFLDPEAMRAPRTHAGPTPRWVVAAGAGVLLVVGLAFAAGLAWRRDDTIETAAATPAASSSSVVATRATDVLESGLSNVANLCDLDVAGAPTREVLEVAQASCGADGSRPRRSLRPELEDEPRVPSDDEDEPARPARPPRPVADAPDPAPKEPAGGRNNCMKTCMRVQEECVEACGKEPKDASQYDAYLGCTGKCIKSSSRCRTSCP